ncbi:MAG: acyl-phosphate--glycerol-3-phosphate O-acyltransferase [Campylobacteraceae bacterium 4484_166]|nr:MAG: acyl-phosphate--glycerol-3-phosphate O-acyltransferase [Campylobacteraceae bacterium 4484_166]
MDFFTNSNLLFYIIAYLAGSIPFGLILAKYYAKIDINQEGSKSIGATNVLRVVKQVDPTLAKKLGIATILLDSFKGALVLLVAIYLQMPLETLWAIAILSVLGHCYSIFMVFEGGKGVATALGVFLVLIPIPTVIGAVVWIFVAKVLKISSISSLSGLIAIVVSTIILNDGLSIGSNAPLYIIAFIIFYKHIPNIIRLFKNEELKV